MDMGLKCDMQTMVGQQPKNTFDAKNIVLKPVSKMPDQITASIGAKFVFKNRSRI